MRELLLRQLVRSLRSGAFRRERSIQWTPGAIHLYESIDE